VYKKLHSALISAFMLSDIIYMVVISRLAPVADPGISEGGVEGRGSGAALKPPVGPGQSPGGGTEVEAPGS
jgi:hypothetical protein